MIENKSTEILFYNKLEKKLLIILKDINKGFNIEENFCNNGIKKRDNNSDDINIYNKYYD